MKPFFTEDDRDVSGRDAMFFKSITINKANRLLSERGKVVYSDHLEETWGEDKDRNGFDKNHALLINVQPIKPQQIEQDSAEKVLKEMVDWWVSDDCSDRNDLIVRAKALLAKEGK